MDSGLAAFLGVLIGGLITSVAKWLEHRHSWKTERRRAYILKLEELHQKCHELRILSGEMTNKSEEFSAIWEEFDVASRKFDSQWLALARQAGYLVSQSHLFLPGFDKETMDIWESLTKLKSNEQAFVFSRGKIDPASRAGSLGDLFQAIEVIEDEIVKRLRAEAGVAN